MLNPTEIGGWFTFTTDPAEVVPLSEARESLTDLISKTRQGEFPVIGRYREPGAALVAPDLLRHLPLMISSIARDTARFVAGQRSRQPDAPVYNLGDPWPWIARALWVNGHRAMFAQFASDTLDEIRNQDEINGLPRMTIAEFLEAMPMTLGGDLPDDQVGPATALLAECLPVMNPR